MKTIFSLWWMIFQKLIYCFNKFKRYDLLKLIIEKYSEERKNFNHYVSNPNEVEEILIQGAYKARITADKVLRRVRKKLGY